MKLVLIEKKIYIPTSLGTDSFISKNGGFESSIQNASQYYKDTYDNKTDKSIRSLSGQVLFTPGKIYTFDYFNANADNMDYFDTKPLVLSLGHVVSNKKVYEIGINFSFLPYEIKRKLLDVLSKKFASLIKANSEKGSTAPMPLDLSIGMSLLKPVGYVFAIRQYALERRSNIKEVSYYDWPLTSLIETKLKDKSFASKRQIIEKMRLESIAKATKK